MAEAVTLGDIYRARETIAGRVRRTPLLRSPSLSARQGQPVWLKLEHQQITGSFKLRGATNAVLGLSKIERERGVVGVSTGNHGRGLAQACKDAGVPCIICMSSLVPKTKVEGIEALGAEVRIVGVSQDEAQVEVDRLVEEQGMTMLPPFDHVAVIAGQGTLGLEIVEDLDRNEGEAGAAPTVVVPLSGGGLISGVACAVKSRMPEARVVGVSMERGAAMIESLRAGKPVPVEELPSLADSLGGGIGLANRYTFPMARDLVDELVTLTEAEIAEGVRHAYREEREVIEGGAAVGIAALLADKLAPEGPVVLVLSGGNIDMKQHYGLITGDGSVIPG